MALAFRTKIRIIRAEKQYATTKRPLVVENHFSRRNYYPRLTASGIYKMILRHILLFGKPLRAFSTKNHYESMIWPRVMNSGMVIMKKIGQPACLLPNGDLLANGRAPETERIWVVNEGLSNLKRHEIQSSPMGNLWVFECLFQLSAKMLLLYYFLLFQNYF